MVQLQFKHHWLVKILTWKHFVNSGDDIRFTVLNLNSSHPARAKPPTSLRHLTVPAFSENQLLPTLQLEPQIPKIGISRGPKVNNYFDCLQVNLRFSSRYPFLHFRNVKFQFRVLFQFWLIILCVKIWEKWSKKSLTMQPQELRLIAFKSG